MSCRYRVDPIAAQRSVMLLYALTLALAHHCLLVIHHAAHTKHGMVSATTPCSRRLERFNSMSMTNRFS